MQAIDVHRSGELKDVPMEEHLAALAALAERKNLDRPFARRSSSVIRGKSHERQRRTLLADWRPGLRPDCPVRPHGRLPQGQECRALRHLRPRRRPATSGCRRSTSRRLPMLTTTRCSPTQEVDAVIIAIADQFHVPAALKAIAAGKHVLVEKPLGTDDRAMPRAARQGSGGRTGRAGRQQPPVRPGHRLRPRLHH